MSDKKYKTGGDKFNLKAIVTRVRHLKMIAIAAAKGMSKNEAVDDAIQDWNEKNKGVLG